MKHILIILILLFGAGCSAKFKYHKPNNVRLLHQKDLGAIEFMDKEYQISREGKGLTVKSKVFNEKALMSMGTLMKRRSIYQKKTGFGLYLNFKVRF